MKKTGWQSPTRRGFVGMLGAAVAAVAINQVVKPRAEDDDRPRDTWSGSTRWIGHC